MMKIFVTFGQNHTHSVNGKVFDKDCIAQFEADYYMDGRRKAFEMFDNKWCMIYAENDFDEKMLKYFPDGIVQI